ncbi:phosphate/phosphite/phosphonate ABC transporter substrate-binding protein [Lactobacillus sp. ESL0684]|uniref:phosphate/phosphite/phosphonate ABC transporter substrate-binding protein n=1 Tax=unclassified Lactobacillus TaxID=2620435 RepID=UPI0023F692FA|nr:MULTISPECIES: phosphate/phosphite/phosphonate ABC transporter substrate-binding protein [unclassified Lactobacillus]WEV39685.1 phosphate/phosphite/phosphonate ABC transporter substrate-binding protein [Lactobacillus sp. ESL0681]WEV43784.1 phosphate/phosphite/phosphonate ABC transporter substrate-binding protein [Lactobacillus sp. ESL0684]
MKKIRRFLLGFVAILGTVLLTACSQQTSQSKSKSYTPKSLTVEFVPSIAANKLEGRAKPLEKMLSKKLGIPVHVLVSTSDNALMEAMRSKKVDVGFLPPDGYVVAHRRGAADVLLQSERYDIKQPGGRWTNTLTKSFRAEIVARKDSKVKNWKDLKGKSVSIQSPTSTAGYIYPIAELKQKGFDVLKNCKLVTVTGHDQAVLNVLNGDTDAAFVFEDARNKVLKDYPKIMSKVVPIYFTKARIPNDTVSVVPSMSKAFRKKLSKAFIEISKSKKGHKLIENVYAHEGYVPVKDSDFDTVRKYEKIVKTMQK